MDELTIAGAFKLRNKLKTRILFLTGMINIAKVVKDKGDRENTAFFDGMTFQQTLDCTVALMDALRRLNFAIDQANFVNRESLITLETTNSELALYNSVADKCRREIKTTRLMENEAGGYTKVELEPLIDQRAVVTRLNSLKKAKEDLEESLAASNFKTPVNFNIREVQGLL